MSPIAAPPGDGAAPADRATLATRSGGEEADAEQGAGQQPLEKVGPPLVARPEATMPEQPC